MALMCELETRAAWQERMVTMFLDGHTLQEIGDVSDVTRERVRQILKATGIKRWDGGIHLKAQRKDATRKAARAAALNARRINQYGCTAAEFETLNGCATIRRGSYAHAFRRQRQTAHHRGIAWGMTFPEWMAVWRESGHLRERGRAKNLYVMARRGDYGPYVKENVYITTMARNVVDYQDRLRDVGVVCADGYKRLPERAMEGM